MRRKQLCDWGHVLYEESMCQREFWEDEVSLGHHSEPVLSTGTQHPSFPSHTCKNIYTYAHTQPCRGGYLNVSWLLFFCFSFESLHLIFLHAFALFSSSALRWVGIKIVSTYLIQLWTNPSMCKWLQGLKLCRISKSWVVFKHWSACRGLWDIIDIEERIAIKMCEMMKSSRRDMSYSVKLG